MKENTSRRVKELIKSKIIIQYLLLGYYVKMLFIFSGLVFEQS